MGAIITIILVVIAILIFFVVPYNMVHNWGIDKIELEFEKDRLDSFEEDIPMLIEDYKEMKSRRLEDEREKEAQYILKQIRKEDDYND